MWSRLHPESNDEYPSTGMVQPPVAFIRKCQIAPIKRCRYIIKEYMYDNHHYFYKKQRPSKRRYISIITGSQERITSYLGDIFETMESPEYSFEKDGRNIDASRPS
jgi:hypothetical protein